MDNFLSISTKLPCGSIHYDEFWGFWNNHKCGRMFWSSMSHFTFFPSFFPHMVWIKFSQTFFSTCMTSKQCRIKRSYHRKIVRQLWMLLKFYWRVTLNIVTHMILKLDFDTIKHNWRDNYENYTNQHLYINDENYLATIMKLKLTLQFNYNK